MMLNRRENSSKSRVNYKSCSGGSGERDKGGIGEGGTYEGEQAVPGGVQAQGDRGAVPPRLNTDRPKEEVFWGTQLDTAL